MRPQWAGNGEQRPIRLIKKRLSIACACMDATTPERPFFNRDAPNSRPIEQDGATPPEGQTVGWRVGFGAKLASPVCCPIIFSIRHLDAVVNADCVHCRRHSVDPPPQPMLAMALYCGRPRCDCHRRLTTTPVGKWVILRPPPLSYDCAAASGQAKLLPRGSPYFSRAAHTR